LMTWVSFFFTVGLLTCAYSTFCGVIFLIAMIMELFE
jgi:hypothetical protein